MDYTSLPYDVPSGYFPDSMHDTPLNLEAGFPSEEDFLNDRLTGGLNLDVLQLLYMQSNGMGKLPSDGINMFPPTLEMMGVASADSGKYHHQHQPPPLYVTANQVTYNNTKTPLTISQIHRPPHFSNRAGLNRPATISLPASCRACVVHDSQH